MHTTRDIDHHVFNVLAWRVNFDAILCRQTDYVNLRMCYKLYLSPFFYEHLHFGIIFLLR